MADEVQIKRWVVLVQKAPIGPLTKEEIRVLLQQKIIRHNDVACLVDTEKKETGWKFLWQFEEFDRRLLVDELGKTIKPGIEATKLMKGASTPPPPERRKENPNPPKLNPEVIPFELRTITPEDLILKSKPRTAFEIETEITPSESSAKHEFNMKVPLVVGAMTFVAVIVTLVTYFKSPQTGTTTPRNDDAVVDSSMPTGDGPLNGSGRSNASIPRRQAPIIAPRQNQQNTVVIPEPAPAPRESRYREERDRGEIPRSESVQVDEEELAQGEEITEEDIIEARAFKAKKAREKRKIKPRALANEEDDVGESSADPEFPAEE